MLSLSQIRGYREKITKLGFGPVADTRRPNCNEFHVRFGSKADMCGAPGHVRFTAKSDIKCAI